MSAESRIVLDVDSWFTRPLVTICSTGISAARLLFAFVLILAILWISRSSERWLLRLAARRPQQFSSASAYALGG